MFQHVLDFKVVHDAITSSVHLPIIATFNLKFKHELSQNMKLEERTRFSWSAPDAELFCERLYNVLPDLASFTNNLEDDVEQAADFLCGMMQSAAEPLKRKPNNNQNDQRRRQPRWWDAQLQNLKDHKTQLLNMFRCTHSADALKEFLNVKRLFKECFNYKEINYKRSLQKIINASLNNTTLLWKVVKQICKNEW
jgi:Mg2+ and Co2+ transporter CorA